MSRRGFDWDTATDAERLVWAQRELARALPRLASAQAKHEKIMRRKLAIDRQERDAREAAHAISETCAGLRGHIRRLTH